MCSVWILPNQLSKLQEPRGSSEKREAAGMQWHEPSRPDGLLNTQRSRLLHNLLHHHQATPSPQKHHLWQRYYHARSSYLLFCGRAYAIQLLDYLVELAFVLILLMLAIIHLDRHFPRLVDPFVAILYCLQLRFARQLIMLVLCILLHLFVTEPDQIMGPVRQAIGWGDD